MHEKVGCQTTLIDPTLDEKVGGQLTPLIPCFRGLCCAYCVRMVCRRHLYTMYFGQPSSPRFYMVHQRGLVCVHVPLIVPHSTRSVAGVIATSVPMTLQLLKICSLTLTIHYLNALSITQRTSYTHPSREI